VALDFMVAQAVFRARQIERATNDPGPWTITYGTEVMPAVRWVGEDRVIFRAHLADACWIDQEDPTLTLRCRGDVVGVRPIESPTDGRSAIEWTFVIPQPVRV
jgi:hypothetical protein